MFPKQRLTLLSAAGCALVVTSFALLPSAVTAAEATDAPMLAYDDAVLQPALNDGSAALQPAVAFQNFEAAAQAPAADDDASNAIDPASLDCMAKIVMHESRGQPRRGQVAVAQTLVHRLKAGRFGNSICAVANQPGQYFNTASYNPRRDGADWEMAVDVSHDVLSGAEDVVAPGAIFFRAAYKPANTFFRSRKGVTTIGGHVFYR